MPGSPSTLLEIAHLIDDCLVGDPINRAFYVEDDPTHIVLGVRALHDHPCEELADLVARPDWRAFGVRLHGTAHVLDAPGEGPQPIVSTYFVDRYGTTASLLRRSDLVMEDHGPVVGRIPDLCRHILSTAGAEEAIP